MAFQGQGRNMYGVKSSNPNSDIPQPPANEPQPLSCPGMTMIASGHKKPKAPENDKHKNQRVMRGLNRDNMLTGSRTRKRALHATGDEKGNIVFKERTDVVHMESAPIQDIGINGVQTERLPKCQRLAVINEAKRREKESKKEIRRQREEDRAALIASVIKHGIESNCKEDSDSESESHKGKETFMERYTKAFAAAKRETTPPESPQPVEEEPQKKKKDIQIADQGYAMIRQFVMHASKANTDWIEAYERQLARIQRVWNMCRVANVSEPKSKFRKTGQSETFNVMELDIDEIAAELGPSFDRELHKKGVAWRLCPDSSR